MTDWSLLLIPLVIIIDGLAIWDLINKKQYSHGMKILWIVVIILFPILGVSIYYFQVSLFHRNSQRKHNRKN
ncbi:PLD nuclease N-terminal domain-containing protein [Proteiniphilum sp. X52]|uniref:PLD nuclease N-terminal domain-containing protein n=1 Tax=Proteiniphilum sp. X52 TaxID=2382159 RepID=UPI000F0A776F|nr:PLDc_N domain-containing protein [Proteiniphilum sp. X52]